MTDTVAAIGDADQLHASYAKVRAMKEHTPDLVVVASHDLTAEAKLAA